MNKQPWYLNNFLVRFEENKDHLIDKLELKDEQKEILKAFFQKYPNYESKIDWNKKDLTFDDFKELLANEGKSKSQAKKNGLAGLKEGEDYLIIDQNKDFIAYQPLTYLGSKTIASNAVPPVKENGAKWCIAYQKTSSYWNDYTKRGIKFIFVCTKDTKYALVQYSSKDNLKQRCYSFEDDNILCPEEFKYLYDILLAEVEKEAEEIRKAEEEKEKRIAQLKLQLKPHLHFLYKKWIETGIASLPEEDIYKDFITEIIIPDSVTSIGDLAFYNCKKLTNIVIPDSVTSIGKSAFANCYSLKNITIPNSVTEIGADAFGWCINLISITIPNSVKSIGPGAFVRCTRLTDITIPNSIRYIKDRTFAVCTSLQSITIPTSVMGIGNKALSAMSRHLTIYYRGTEEQWKKIAGSKGIKRPIVFMKK